MSCLKQNLPSWQNPGRILNILNDFNDFPQILISLVPYFSSPPANKTATWSMVKQYNIYIYRKPTTSLKKGFVFSFGASIQYGQNRKGKSKWIPWLQKTNLTTWFFFGLLVGGSVSTHLENMRTSNWPISPGIRGETKRIFEFETTTLAPKSFTQTLSTCVSFNRQQKVYTPEN